MILTLTTTHSPARDLGFLLYKHPDRSQTFDLSFGQAHVTYPEATADKCTAAMILDVDPVGLVRGWGETLSQYVNDRPYVASSLLSVAIAQVYGTALSGRCKERPELAETPLPFTATLSVVPERGRDGLVHRLFEPLGYTVSTETHALSDDHPEWGDSPYVTLTLEHTVRLQDILRHLYILMPVLDNDKHYFVGDEEIEKMLRYGEGWLHDHPERRFITRRYLQFGSVIRDGLKQLEERGDSDQGEDVESVDDASAEETSATQESEDAEGPDAGNEGLKSGQPKNGQPKSSAQMLRRPERLNTLRMEAVAFALKVSGARRVLDLGCGEGKLIRRLLHDEQFDRLTGVDVSLRRLEYASERLSLDEKPPSLREKVSLLHGSLLYRDRRLQQYDAAALVEVVEHIEPHRLRDLERSVFGFASPKMVVVTTPNAEFNALFSAMGSDEQRHHDHRFEWTREQFADWCDGVAEMFGYTVDRMTVGPVDQDHGSPTQMAIFRK